MIKLYIIKSINSSKTYVGITNDLERRIKEHNLGLTQFTSTFKPWELIYHEDLEDIESARKKERYFKSSAGRKKMKIIIQSFLEKPKGN